MTVQTSAGSTLAITASAPATFDAAGYNALTYVNIGEITDLGELGREYALVNHSPLGDRRVKKFKGSYQSGSISLQFGKDFSDAGQILLTTASTNDNTYTFRLTLQDGKKLYFTGMVMTAKVSVGSVDQITGGTSQIEIHSDVLEV